jgi:hypothetical protein
MAGVKMGKAAIDLLGQTASQVMSHPRLFGPQPAFGLDELKIIFWLPSHNYTTFFQDGTDATKRGKISSDAKILIVLKCLAYGTTVNVSEFPSFISSTLTV